MVLDLTQSGHFFPHFWTITILTKICHRAGEKCVRGRALALQVNKQKTVSSGTRSHKRLWAEKPEKKPEKPGTAEKDGNRAPHVGGRGCPRE
eukprot:2596768-Prymnesium_polylepis.1